MTEHIITIVIRSENRLEADEVASIVRKGARNALDDQGASVNLDTETRLITHLKLWDVEVMFI